MTTSTQQQSSSALEVRGPRLRLVAIDAELARLQVTDKDGFFAALGAQREPAWPPIADDEPKLADKLEILNRTPEEAGWRGWVFLMGWTPDGLDRAVGVGGFHGPPDADGQVEIGYAMQPSFREQGLATEAVEGLVKWAFDHPEVRNVRAQTLPHLTASIRVLEKTGFTFVKEYTDESGDTLCLFERKRD
ncbi:GNAT family N-acetyltransferase [Oceanicaulis alexandrii]|uniref:GNAT family N-acetyltransferase n=1 Tax=Oceanicaulis alexandrii TaxID=153233 RepID=UPI0035CEB1AD